MQSSFSLFSAMTSISRLMTDDHRRCDDFLAEAELAVGKKDAAAAPKAFEHFRQAILAHFESEEKTLFPAFEARTGMSMGPTRVMRMEHSQMRDLLEEAGAALKEADFDNYLGLSETLLIMMQQHNMKEESMLYPMCEQHLAAEAPMLVERLAQELSAA